MNKKWISQLAGDIEEKYGKDTRETLFGDIDSIKNDPIFLANWFDNFVTGMDKLDDKAFLQAMMANRCPCGGGDAGNAAAMKEFYDNSKTLEEFVDSFGKWMYKKYNGDVDTLKLQGNVLYLTKPLMENPNAGSCGKGCHCFLARNTEKVVSKIFCHCCTIGHTGKMFKIAFGDDIRMEFIESIICGGKGCTMTVHLPE
ncbi:MAG: hypothetical protein FWE11_04335 [Defluviitaleaceae bacterium]|nr:hypothetical protein [Defluviitaleaceae bacterium]